MTDCRLVIVRHGETDANRTGVLQGQSNCPLNDNGRRQAAAAAERLAGEHFDAAYSSDLVRAFETAGIVVRSHAGLAVCPVKELREWFLGDMEDRPQTELLKLYPEEMAAFRREACEVRIPGGESLTEFQARVSNFLTALADRNPGKRILLVTHGGVLQRIFRMAVGMTAPGNFLSLSENASICMIRRDIEAGAWQLITWNSTDHLRGLPMHDTLVY